MIIVLVNKNWVAKISFWNLAFQNGIFSKPNCWSCENHRFFYLREIENQQSTVYVVNCQFLRHPDRCWDLTYFYRIWKLSNEVGYDPAPRGVLRMWQVKVYLNSLDKSRTFNFDLSYHWYPISCGNTLNIHQDVLKSSNLLHNSFVCSQLSSTLNEPHHEINRLVGVMIFH